MRHPSPTRRAFIAAAGSAAVGAVIGAPSAFAQPHSQFKLGVVTDEISQDFNRACTVAAKEFGMQQVALRTLWNRSIIDLNSGDVSRAKTILRNSNLSVSEIASPLFKVDWPHAPRSKFSIRQNFANADFAHQHSVLSRCLALAQEFNSDRIRCFDFWRLDDVAPHRAAIDDLLSAAAAATAKQGIKLVIENDYECNTATAQEAASILRSVPGLMLDWDPANAVMAGELDAYPGGWDLLPKDRIRYCHCKNVERNAAGALAWAPVDIGLIDWTAQFRALKDAGYSGGIALETHWRGGGTPEASSRASWAAMKRALEDSGSL
jgi:sugar phosphate isomerase/epimerase